MTKLDELRALGGGGIARQYAGKPKAVIETKRNETKVAIETKQKRCVCGALIEAPATGRVKAFCSPRCRLAVHRAKQKAK